MERTTTRRNLKGKVVSDKADKTITVQIDTYRAHKLYGKRVKYSKKFLAHDEKNEAHIGDIVTIQETRPLSKNKNFRLLKINEVRVIK